MTIKELDGVVMGTPERKAKLRTVERLVLLRVKRRRT